MDDQTGNTIHRAPHDKAHPGFEMSRATAQDKNISYAALGLLTYLLSQSDNWDVVIPDLLRKKCGRDKAYHLLNELKDAGYIVQGRLEAGQQKPPLWAERHVYERPFTEMPDTVTPYPEIPETEKSGNGEPIPEKPETETRETPARAATESTESLTDLKDKRLKDQQQRARIYTLYEQLCKTTINAITADALKDDAATYPADWIEKAVEEAALSGATSWKYVRSILERWRRDGFPGTRPQVVAKPSTPAQPPATPYVSPGVDMNAIVAQLASTGDNDPSWTPQREASGAWKPQQRPARTGSNS
jgi:DnaD/phage-associated family protein